jgi:hypothetical protein
MKLQELAVANPTKQAAKVFESYFGDRISFESMTQQQARGMLKRVRNLIAEHRRTPAFHHSERNNAYLKLVMMEQALATQAVAPGVTAPGAATANPQQQAGLMAAQQQQKKRQLQDEIKQLQAQIAEKQKEMNNPVMAPMESKLYRRLREASEVQQAQVVLASQDMVDQVQKMSEQISAMQFKDLPALVDQIKNEVGVDQATQFNGDASAALSGLLQNLQGAKQQLEAALGVVTGQAPQVPGEDMTAPAMGGEELPPELPAPGAEEISVDAEVEEPATAGLGRDRR